MEGVGLANARRVPTEVTSLSPPLAPGVRRRPHPCRPRLRVRLKDPRAEAEPMGLALAFPNSPLDGALAGLEVLHHLNPGDHIPPSTHNPPKPSPDELSR